MRGCWQRWAGGAALALLILSNAASPVHAAPSLSELESELHDVHLNLVAYTAKANQLQQAENQTQGQLNAVDAQLAATQASIAATQASIKAIRQRMAVTSRRLLATRRSLGRQQGGLDAVLLYTEQYGPLGYLAVLMHVASFGDFVTRASDVIEVASFESLLVHSLNRDANAIHRDLMRLARSQAELARQKASLEQQRAQLASVADQRRQVLATQQGEKQQELKIAASLQAQGQKLWDAIQQIKAELADGQVSQSQLLSIVKSIASVYGIDPLLIMAVIREESGGNTKAVSSAGAKGLMQLMPGTASELGVSDPFNPVQNVHGGIAYLSYLINLFKGNIPFALAAYNAGPNAVKAYGGIPPYPETRNYVKNIMWMYEHGI